MHLNDFDFDLPPEQIAQVPVPHRGSSRLMVLDRASSTASTGTFDGIIEYFRPGDVLVINDTRVIPARLLGTKDSGGKIEVFLVRRLFGEEEQWACLTKSSKPPKVGCRLLLGGEIVGTVLDGGEAPYRHIGLMLRKTFSKLSNVSGISLCRLIFVALMMPSIVNVIRQSMRNLPVPLRLQPPDFM